MAHPLLCWDIVMEGSARRKEFAKDITALQNCIKANGWYTLLESAVDNCIVWENKTIIVTDPALQIILATKNIYEMNGYQPHEVIGKHPKMFQGEATSIVSRKKIKTAVEKQVPFECDIVNYRKDGRIYTCHIEGYPIFNRKKQLVNFIAIENAA
ncbi:MAG: PAS domain-containing protein [Ferruginibacter sp.]